MNSPSPLRSPWRVPRAHLEDNTPAVLRFPNGQRIGASLQVISLTGGLLALPQLLVQGAQVKLMFLTGCGSVLGGAEMLSPISDALQPFRFISLAAEDHRRLGTLIWEQTKQNKFDQAWIEKLRAATAPHHECLPWQFSRAHAYGLLTLGLGAAAYLLCPGLLK
jgi:hypothetical protein